MFPATSALQKQQLPYSVIATSEQKVHCIVSMLIMATSNFSGLWMQNLICVI